MARVKNVGGGPSDEDLKPPPCQPTDPKGKATKKLAIRKHKYPDAYTARAAAVAEVAERAERGGAHSGVWIVDQLSPEARATLEQVERLHGGPPRTLCNNPGFWRSQKYKLLKNFPTMHEACRC